VAGQLRVGLQHCAGLASRVHLWAEQARGEHRGAELALQTAQPSF
jgi:hypothetical protein